MKITPESFAELLARLEAVRKQGGVDLSADEDLAVAVMNLVSLEEHFFFTAAKTADAHYLETLAEVRSARHRLMSKLLPAHEAETWCAAKHLLSGTMRLIETGTKLQTSGRGSEAAQMFQEAYHLFSLFWALKLKLVEAKQLGDVSDCCKE